MAEWNQVTAESHCPICGKARRCKISPDGNAVRCFRVAQAPPGWNLHKSHSSGGTFFRVGQKAPRSNSTKSRSRTTAAPIGSPLSADRLHFAYSMFLDMCVYTTKRIKLCESHLRGLVARGLTPEEIERRGYRTMPGFKIRNAVAARLAERLGEEFDLVPGFGRQDGRPSIFGAAGIAIPTRNAAGQIVAILVRADSSDANSKYTFLSSRKYGGHGPGSPPHVPIGVTAPAPMLRLVEGHLKADVISSIDPIPTVSFGGVGRWREGFALAKELGAKTLRWAFDSDAPTNPDVARSLLDAVRATIAEGFALEVERWDAADGKGLDDLLVSGKQPEVLAGEFALAATVEIAKAAGVDLTAKSSSNGELLDRVKVVLKENAAEGLFLDSELLEDIAAAAVHSKAEYAAIRTVIRGAGISARDFDSAIKEKIVAAYSDLSSELARDPTGGFFEHNGCICRKKFTMGQPPQIVQLSNFDCRIIDETIYDDGAEQQIVLGVEGRLDNGRQLPRIEVPGEQFESLEWIVPKWGSDAIVWPGERRSLGPAIQGISLVDADGKSIKKNQKTVFTHTGWRKVGDSWAYLHGSGLIAPSSKLAQNSAVKLQPPLDRFALPEPPRGEELKTAVRASLELLTVSPDRISVPLFAAVWRSVVCPADFTVSLIGPTGVQKTEMAALAQQHFGRDLDARHLPGSWSSTANSNERLAFLAKDALLVVDDFAPHGSSGDVSRYHSAADRLLRGQGNNAGRQRMRHDGTLRPPTPPRGLILVTGEDVTRGQSVRSRQLIIEVARGDVDLEALTIQQRNAAAMAGYLLWLSTRYESILACHKSDVEKLRDEAANARLHARTPTITAELTFGLRLFLKFAASVGAITQIEREQLRQRFWTALTTAAAAQAHHQEVSDPPTQFIRLVLSALTTGRVHLASRNNQIPTDTPGATPDILGWRRADDGGDPHFNSNEWRPQGKRIGWTDGDYFLLDPNAAFAEVQRYAIEQGESFTVSLDTLKKRLNERRLLAVTDLATSRKTVAHRVRIQGAQIETLCFRADTLLSFTEPLTQMTQLTQPSDLLPAAAEPSQLVSQLPSQLNRQLDSGLTHENGHFSEENIGRVNRVNCATGREKYIEAKKESGDAFEEYRF